MKKNGRKYRKLVREREQKLEKIEQSIIIYLLGISGAGIDADSQVEKLMRLQVKE